jgi:hypothetical protein
MVVRDEILAISRVIHRPFRGGRPSADIYIKVIERWHTWENIVVSKHCILKSALLENI